MEDILKQDNKTPFYEQYTRSDEGKAITVCNSKNHRFEVNESNLAQMNTFDAEGNGWDSDKKTPFTTEADSPFADYKPTLSQTTVFIHRFFMGKPFKEIAEALEIDENTAVTHYRNAKERMLEALKFTDSRQQTIKHYESLLKRNEKSFGKLPNGQRLFIMNAVCGLTVPEIAKLEGMPAIQVNHRIKETSDRLKNGNLVFLNPTPEEVKAAQRRIDKRRQRDKKTV